MSKDEVTYPVIVEEFNDEKGEKKHHYVATSPNIQGLVTYGDTITELVEHVQDAIACLLNVNEYPEVQDPTKWELKENQQVMWFNIDLNQWRKQNSKVICRSITIPEYLHKWAKKNCINVSQIATQELFEIYKRLLKK